MKYLFWYIKVSSVDKNWSNNGILLVNVLKNFNSLPGLVFILPDFPSIVQWNTYIGKFKCPVLTKIEFHWCLIGKSD